MNRLQYCVLLAIGTVLMLLGPITTAFAAMDDRAQLPTMQDEMDDRSARYLGVERRDRNLKLLSGLPAVPRGASGQVSSWIGLLRCSLTWVESDLKVLPGEHRIMIASSDCR